MKHIVVCDDNVEFSETIRKALAEANFSVSVINDSRQLFGFVSSSPCDLLILDYNMSPLDGRATAQQIRSKFNPGELPIAFMSGATDKSHLDSLSRLGVSFYFVKPPNFANLIQKCRELIPIRLSVEEVRKFVAQAFVADETLGKEIGLAATTVKKVELFKIKRLAATFIIAKGRAFSTKQLESIDAIALTKAYSLFIQQGKLWHRIWPTTWALDSIKRVQKTASISSVQLSDIKKICANIETLLDEDDVAS